MVRALGKWLGSLVANPDVITFWAVFWLVLLIFVFDAVAIQSEGGISTISSLVSRSCRKYPVLPALLGALFYHLLQDPFGSQ